jgi:hypothetical protein
LVPHAPTDTLPRTNATEPAPRGTRAHRLLLTRRLRARPGFTALAPARVAEPLAPQGRSVGTAMVSSKRPTVSNAPPVCLVLGRGVGLVLPRRPPSLVSMSIRRLLLPLWCVWFNLSDGLQCRLLPAGDWCPSRWRLPCVYWWHGVPQQRHGHANGALQRGVLLPVWNVQPCGEPLPSRHVQRPLRPLLLRAMHAVPASPDMCRWNRQPADHAAVRRGVLLPWQCRLICHRRQPRCTGCRSAVPYDWRGVFRHLRLPSRHILDVDVAGV